MYKCALVPLDMEVALLRVLVPTPPMAIEGTRHVAAARAAREAVR
jgi:hypothetical protein